MRPFGKKEGRIMKKLIYCCVNRIRQIRMPYRSKPFINTIIYAIVGSYVIYAFIATARVSPLRTTVSVTGLPASAYNSASESWNERVTVVVLPLTVIDVILSPTSSFP